MITLNQPSIAHGLAPAALGTSEKGSARHGSEAGACRVSDVLATITADPDGDDALDIPVLVAHGVGPIGMTAGELPAAARAVLNLLGAEKLV